MCIRDRAKANGDYFRKEVEEIGNLRWRFQLEGGGRGTELPVRMQRKDGGYTSTAAGQKKVFEEYFLDLYLSLIHI